MKYKLKRSDVVYDGFVKIKKVWVEHDSFHQDTPISKEREYVVRGDAVAIVIYERDTDSILFVNQFRLPTTENQEGWLLEIPAGLIEQNEIPLDCAIREVKEELGYEVSDLSRIFTFYTSPGCLSERTILYYAEVDTSDKTEKGGGLEEEKEDIQLVKILVNDVSNKIENGDIRDAKSIIGIQWFLANQFKNKKL